MSIFVNGQTLLMTEADWNNATWKGTTETGQRKAFAQLPTGQGGLFDVKIVDQVRHPSTSIGE